MEARYNVYFAGQLLEGQDLQQVRARLGKVFKADEQTLDKLFSGKAQLLKRDCDKTTALKYKNAMEKAGAAPIIKAVEEAPAQTSPAQAKSTSAAGKIAALAAAPDKGAYQDTAAAPAPKAAQPQDSDPAEGAIDLAPPGTEVLRENERIESVAREVDTSSLVLDAQAERLSEPLPPPPAAPDTSHLDMGAAGETIPTLPSRQQPVSPDIDGLDLSPEGSDFNDCASPEQQAPELDLSDLNLAPTGTDVLEERYRNPAQPAAPSTDHISLED